MSELAELVGQVDKIRKSSPRLAPRAYMLTDDLKKLTNGFTCLSRENRKEIMKYIDPDTGRKMISIANACARRAIDEKNHAWIKIGILAHILENLENDYRENIRRLILLHHAAIKIGTNFSLICDDLYQYCTNNMEIFLKEFCTRTPGQNKLSDVV